jgi:AraC-like DNA-binding protein
MLKMRQAAHPCPKLSAQITTLTYEFASGHAVPEHFHQEDQLVYASQGVMTVRTNEGTWVVPPQRAVWIPARTPHGILMSGAVSMRTLYLKPRLVQNLPRSCRVLNISPLLRELVLHACRFPALKRKVKVQSHLIEIIVDQLETVQGIPLQLPSPLDPRAVRVAEALYNDPSDSCPLTETCRVAGASKRTIERLFQQETRLTLGRWRQQLRLMRSLQLLAAGEKITHVALEAGYSTPSAFIAMFRKILGITPGRYFDNSV